MSCDVGEVTERLENELCSRKIEELEDIYIKADGRLTCMLCRLDIN